MAQDIFPRMHVSLYVSDIDKTVDFYTRFFGENPAKVRPRYAKFVLESPSLIILLLKMRSACSKILATSAFK